MRCISQGTRHALVRVPDSQSEGVPPPLMDPQSEGQAHAAGWMLCPQHQWFCASSPLRWGRTACQCLQSLCSPGTRDRGTAATHTTVGGSGGDCSPLHAAVPLCTRAFVSAATALLGSAGTAVSGLDRYRLVFAFCLSLALICNF